jgi:hypothetical protein
MDNCTEKLVCSLDYTSLIGLINRAEQRVCLVLPGIFDELAGALAARKRSGIARIQVLTDVSEDNVRNGFGSISAIETLCASGVDVYECSDNLVSFVICDEIGYWLFPQSRIFRFEETGTNAASIDPIMQIRLLHQFFPSLPNEVLGIGVDGVVNTLEQLVQQVCDEMAKPPDLDRPIYLLDENELKKTKGRLEINPPLHPDLKRQISTYVAKIQFSELTFEGANLHTAKVTLPPDALPFGDAAIKRLLETRMRLFENLEELDGFKKFLKLKGTIEEIRKQFLTPISSRKKSILRVERKTEFIKQVEEAEATAAQLNQEHSELLEGLMLNSKDRIEKEIVEFFKRTPPENVAAIKDERLRERKIQDMAARILAKIRYPDPQHLLDKLSIKKHFYDVTFEDFRDEEFLKELEEKEVMEKDDISSIVSIRDAFSVKPDTRKEGAKACH